MIAYSFLLEPDPAQAWKLNRSVHKFDCAIQPKTVMDALSLVFGESCLLIALLESTKEVLECSLKISQGFLRGALGDLIHPRKIDPLELIQRSMLFDSVSEAFISLFLPIEIMPLFQPPVIGEPCGARVLEKVRALGVIGVQLVAIGFMDQHYEDLHRGVLSVHQRIPRDSW